MNFIKRMQEINARKAELRSMLEGSGEVDLDAIEKELRDLDTEFKGLEKGIDKLMECAPYINEILADKELLSGLSDMTWIELGGAVYKKHTETCDKLLSALDHKPDTAIGLVSATAQIMGEIFTNQELLDFFMSMSRKAK